VNLRVAALSALCVALAGCATVSRKVAFDGTEGTSFLLLAVDGLVGANSYSYIFRKVDRSSSTFQDDKFRLYIGSDSGTLFEKPKTLDSAATFAGQAVPPGEYALITRSEFSYYGLSSAEGSGCFALGAAIFRVRKGQIQVISLGRGNSVNGADTKQVESQVATVMAAYPNMTAPISMAPVVGHLTFEVDDPNKCNPSGSFKLVE
jgi:hypothetical protein